MVNEQTILVVIGQKIFTSETGESVEILSQHFIETRDYARYIFLKLGYYDIHDENILMWNFLKDVIFFFSIFYMLKKILEETFIFVFCILNFNKDKRDIMKKNFKKSK